MITLDELFADHQGAHSNFQMDNFITLKSGGTLYGCYRQALRELYSRFCNLGEAYNAEPDPSPFRQTVTECTIRETEREFKRFYGQVLALRSALEESGVEFPLSQETRDRLDAEYWMHRLKSMCAVEFMVSGNLTTGTVEAIQALPRTHRRELYQFLPPDRRENLIQWFLEYEIELPCPVLIETEIQKLIPCLPTNLNSPLPIERQAQRLSPRMSSEPDSKSVRTASLGPAGSA